jgi:hypothetical protein
VGQEQEKDDLKEKLDKEKGAEKSKMREGVGEGGRGCVTREFFYSESLAAGSLDQLPAPLEPIPADA